VVGIRPQTLFAERRDMPIERSVHLVLRPAAGDADALSGRYITVEDDLPVIRHLVYRLLNLAPYLDH
jgi:hypothetical protein